MFSQSHTFFGFASLNCGRPWFQNSSLQWNYKYQWGCWAPHKPLKTTYYHELEHAVFYFSEWHDNAIVKVSVWETMGSFFLSIHYSLQLGSSKYEYSKYRNGTSSNKENLFKVFQICTQRCTSSKPCVKSSQHFFKARLKQTKHDASITGASESLTQRLVSAVNYSRTAFNSPCSTNLNHSRLATHAQWSTNTSV